MTLKEESIAHCATRHEPLRAATRGAENMMSLKSETGEYGNQFLETSCDLLVLDTRDIVEKYVIDNVRRIDSLGWQHYAIGARTASREHETYS